MKKVIDEQKRLKVELQKKMRSENSAHAMEKSKILQSELQSKRREQIAQNNVNKLGHQLMNKEKVWKGQINAMERESSKLKDLLKKQQYVKSSNDSKIIRTASTENITSSSILPSSRVIELKSWITKEVDDQAERTSFQEQLSHEIHLRSKAAKDLIDMRKQKTDSINSSGVENNTFEVNIRRYY